MSSIQKFKASEWECERAGEGPRCEQRAGTWRALEHGGLGELTVTPHTCLTERGGDRAGLIEKDRESTAISSSLLRGGGAKLQELNGEYGERCLCSEQSEADTQRLLFYSNPYLLKSKSTTPYLLKK